MFKAFISCFSPCVTLTSARERKKKRKKEKTNKARSPSLFRISVANKLVMQCARNIHQIILRFKRLYMCKEENKKGARLCPHIAQNNAKKSTPSFPGI